MGIDTAAFLLVMLCLMYLLSSTLSLVHGGRDALACCMCVCAICMVLYRAHHITMTPPCMCNTHTLRYLPHSVFASPVVGVPALFGRLLGLVVEVYVVVRHIDTILTADRRQVPTTTAPEIED